MKNILLFIIGITAASYYPNPYNETLISSTSNSNSNGLIISNNDFEKNTKKILIMGNYKEYAINKFVSSISYYFSTIDPTVNYVPENLLHFYKESLHTIKGDIEIAKLPINHGNKTYIFYFNQSVDNALLLLQSDLIEFDGFIMNIMISNGPMPYTVKFLKELKTRNVSNVLSYFSWCEEITDLELQRLIGGDLGVAYFESGFDTTNLNIIYGARNIDSIRVSNKWHSKLELVYDYLSEI